MRNLLRIVLLALTATGLAACSVDMNALPLIGQEPTALPTALPAIPLPTSEAAAEAPATPAEPRPTAPPLPTLPPAPTIEPQLSSALEEEQQLLVELYRRANPAVVSIEVLGQHPAVEGAPAPEQDIPFAQGSGFLIDDQG
ncbi:MAG TPA: 2-alkenal reductase, partial [Roseiflexaceae bacterium]|nr:2-alkenal reductase [Roseiflexaceae bacterium]